MPPYDRSTTGGISGITNNSEPETELEEEVPPKLGETNLQVSSTPRQKKFKIKRNV